MTVRIDIEAIIARVRTAAMRGVVRGTEAVRNDAVTSIQSGPKTGRVYRRRGVEHQASAPGEAPASDTGRLVGSIRTEYNMRTLSGRVIASTTYAAALEYGTPRMEPRPYMRPALAGRREDIDRFISEEVEAELRR